MKIGVFAFRQDPYISANTSIAYIIGEQINKTDEVVYIGRKQSSKQNSISNHKGITIRYLNKYPQKPATSSLFQVFLRRIGAARLSVLKDSLALSKIVRKESIDALLCFCAPSEDVIITRYADLRIPIFLYQLDPYYNRTDNEDTKEKKQFKKMLPYLRHLFTTDILYSKYISDPFFRDYTHITAVKFPKLIKPDLSTESGKDHITLLYAGTLYNSIRSPQILIDLKRILPANCELVFCGACEDKWEESRLKESGIICKGFRNQMEMAKEYGEASFMVNIGNAVCNQMGSKIIDYIATGKPIINIIQFDNCPTLQVLQNYDYSLTIKSRRVLQDKEILEHYIEATYGKRMNWETVFERYYDYTPEFVAQQVMTEMHNT